MKKNTFKFITAIFMVMSINMGLLAQTNQYLHFDRVDDYVSLANGSQYIANGSEFSMAGWFYTDQIVYGQGMVGFRNGSQGFYLIQLDNGIIECRLHNSAGALFEFVAPPNTVIPETWQHYAWVYDGSYVRLFQNGVELGSAPANGTISDGSIQFTIGRSILSTLDFYYGGRADEVTLWSKALTATDITDMMTNELVGNETDLQLYYKMDQGNPGGNNTTITKLISTVDPVNRNADLLGFAMDGATSNFNGILNTSFQAISFDPIPNKLTNDGDFDLVATSSAGLTVLFELISGPAILAGNTLTLIGIPGEVVIRAYQPGDATYDPAVDVFGSFMVIDPEQNLPNIEGRNPLAGNFYIPNLSEIQLAALVNIDYPELFSVSDLTFSIDGSSITGVDWGNGHYTAWWEPTAYGQYTLDIISNNNFGYAQTESITINLVQTVSDMTAIAVENIVINSNNPSVTVEAELPSFLGAFNEISATLSVSCPAGGCGEWDRKASIDAKTHDGRWIEIIRYITPYGTACNHTTDLTDYASLLQGKIAFRVNCGTLDNGYIYDLSIDYKAGTPDHIYSAISVVWQDTYPFGDYANLQPVENKSITFPTEAVASKLKIMNTGHGWGDLNTDNAAEFYEATHKIKVNGDDFSQHLWVECNPNPDGCSPQNGTWYYPRAGWCPGSIAAVYDYDLTQYVSSTNVSLQYKFYDGYIDLCHPNHPDCVTGVTCTDCEDGFNPHFFITGNLITYFDEPYDAVELSQEIIEKHFIQAYPNPNFGNFLLSSGNSLNNAEVSIMGLLGNKIMQFEWDGSDQYIDMTSEKPGIYIIMIQVDGEIETKRILIQ